jgi:hypothetical protein
LVKTLSPAKLLAEAAAVRESAISEARRIERTKAEMDGIEKEKIRRNSKAAKIGSVAARSLMFLLFVCWAMVVILNAGLLGQGWSTGVALPVLAVIFGIYSALDAFGFVDAVSLRKLFERIITNSIRRLQDLLA